MCSVASELIIKLDPRVALKASSSNEQRKQFRTKIDLISNEATFGIEILNLKFFSVENNFEIFNEYFIEKIQLNSVADKVGLKQNDRILEINGQCVKKLDLSEVQFLIKEAKRSYDNKLDMLVGMTLL